MSEARGVVVAHGDMARGLVDAVRRITGVAEGALTALSNEGLAPDDLRAMIQAHLGDGPAIVFTDLGAGSCTFAARLSLVDRERIAVVTGVNLPMLLDFVFHRDLAVSALAARLVEKGRDGVRILATPADHVDRPLPG